MSVSPEIFKEVMGRFGSSVTIVTFKHDSGIHGLTVSAFCSVSLEPPRILVCIKKQGSSHEFLSQSERFVVNILAKEQQDLAWQFSNPELGSEDRFAGASYKTTEPGLPVFTDNLAHLECRIVNQFDGGDHTIFLGEVENCYFSEESAPLFYYNRGFHTL
ncbi:MAG: flavin reductase family protein [Calditrichaeota bacterium]|nr:flavin reductase family protein [Calditrichota bacterium]